MFINFSSLDVYWTPTLCQIQEISILEEVSSYNTVCYLPEHMGGTEEELSKVLNFITRNKLDSVMYN